MVATDRNDPLPAPGRTSPACVRCGFFEHCEAPFVGGPFTVSPDGSGRPGLPEGEPPEGGWLAVVGDPPDATADGEGDLASSESLKFMLRLAEVLGIRDRMVYIPAMLCRPRKPVPGATDGSTMDAKPTPADMERCFGAYVRPALERLRPAGIVASGAVACAKVVGRMDYVNLVGRGYRMLDVPAQAVLPVEYLLRDVQGLQREFMKVWRDALSRVDDPATTEGWEATIGYDLATTAEDAEAWFLPVLTAIREDRAAGRTPAPVSWDVETSSLAVWTRGFIVGTIAFDHPAMPSPLVCVTDLPAGAQHHARLHPGGPSWPEARDGLMAFLRRVMESPKVPKVGHNLQYDEAAVASAYGWKVRGFYADTMLLNFILHPEEKGLNGLDDVCRKLLPEVPPYWERLDAHRKEHGVERYTDLPGEVLFPYAAYDVRAVSMVFDRMLPLLRKPGYGGTFVVATGGVEGAPTDRPTYSLEQYALHARAIHHRLCSHLHVYGQHFDADLVDQVYTHYARLREKASTALSGDPNLIRFESSYLGQHAGVSTDAHKAWKRWREAGMLEAADRAVEEARERYADAREGYKEEAEDWRARRRAWVKETGSPKEEFPEAPPPTPEKPRVKDIKDAVKAAYEYPDGPMPDHLRPRISWASVPQQKMFFVDFMGLPVLKLTDTGGPCLDGDVLAKYAAHPHRNETAGRLIEWRGYDKFIVSFMDPLRGAEVNPEKRVVHDDGLIHCGFGAGSTATGRLSCVAAETPIDTPHGRVRADEIQPGDWVDSGCGRYRRVQEVYYKGVAPMFRITNGRGDSITCTADHRLLTPGGWRRVGDLREGDQISLPRRPGAGTVVPDGPGGGKRVRPVLGAVPGIVPIPIPGPADAQGVVRFAGGDGDRAGDIHGAIRWGYRVEEAGAVQLGALEQREGIATIHTSGRGDAEGGGGRGAARGDDSRPPRGQPIHRGTQPTTLRPGWVGDGQTSEHDGLGLATAGAPGGLVAGAYGRRPQLLRRPGAILREAVRCALGPGGSEAGVAEGQVFAFVSLRDGYDPERAHLLVEQPGGGGAIHGAIEERDQPCEGMASGRGEQEPKGGLRDRGEPGGGGGWKVPRLARCEGEGQTEGRRSRGKGYPRGEGTGEGGAELRYGLGRGGTTTITEIAPAGVRGVWDMCVDCDHAYVSGSFVSHNSRRPNMQAIPRDGLVKRLYGSRHGRDGWVVTRDYSGLEVRIMALMSRDEGLLHTFRTGGDPHFDITQKHFFGGAADAKNKGQRAICKRTLFGNIYGQGDQGLLDILTADGVLSPATGLPVTKEECHEFNQMLYRALPGVGEWVELAHQAAYRDLWAGSAFGFVRPLPALASKRAAERRKAGLSWDERKADKRLRMLEMDIAKDERRSQNMPIQSTASDITVFAAWRINQQYEERGMGARVFNVVHDDIWSDVPSDDEVEEVFRIYKDTMDHVPEWIGEMLPGYDASWIDIPIIGEGELGVNPKDAVAAVSEPSSADPSARLELRVPAEGWEWSGAVPDAGGATCVVPFAGNAAAIKEMLGLRRLVFD